jgi:Flp pilus assembly protein TadD/outer membrane protein OmpA-like peptidoglycan-associated protein
MKKVYSLLIICLLMVSFGTAPFSSFGQEEEEQAKETRKDKKKAFDDYFFINGNVGLFLNHTDISDQRFAPPTDSWNIGYGGFFGWQFAPIWGLRGQISAGQLHGEITDEWLILRDYGFSNAYFDAKLFDYHIDLTINLNNLFAGYNPTRLVNVYAIGGWGAAQWRTESFNADNDEPWGQNGIKGEDPFPLVLDDTKGNGEKDGFGERTMVMEIPVGLGVAFNLSEHFDITFESQLRTILTDRVDTWKKGEMAVYNDMYSYTSLGLTYKFGYGNPLKKMEQNFDDVVFKAEPDPLEAHGGKVPVKITGTFPEKYFHPKASMEFAPVLTYEGGSTPLKTVYLKGEDIGGAGIPVSYDGGTFTYYDTLDYTPAMRASELVVAPTLFLPKEDLPADINAEKIKEYRYLQLPQRKLDDGVIITPTRISTMGLLAFFGPHGYQPEVIISKETKIFFEVNKYKLDWNLPLNKLDANKQKMQEFMDFMALNYKVKNISIDGWASPEGEETFNQGLSENRAKTANTYLIDSFKKMIKDKKLTNIADPKTDLAYNVAHHGPDWNGFLSAIQASDLKDKNIILNVINSAGTPAKKEQEIRNMIVIYPDLETKILPNLRRAEIAVNCYEPKKTNEEIAMLSTTNPGQLDEKELLYAATLTKDKETQKRIYLAAINNYPESYKGYLNAGAVEIELNDLNAAQAHLEKARSLEPNNGMIYHNLGVVAMKKGDLAKAEEYYNTAKGLGEDENYNLGIIEITKGNYAKAVSLFGSKSCDYNLALAQIAAKNYPAAEKALNCAPKDAGTYYLAAILGARTSNTTMLFENLTKAVQEDPAYKTEAKIDREFIKYFNDPNFTAIVN